MRTDVFRSSALLFSSLLCAGAAAAQSPNVGLSAVRARSFANEDLLVFQPAHFDFFGAAVATGDFNGDLVQDLATGIPWDDGLAGAGVLDCGVVVVRYGVAGAGLETGFADDVLSQQYGGSQDPAEAGDLFGFALAAGDFNGDNIDDLAVGIPLDTRDYPDVSLRQGAVQIHYGGVGGIQLVGEHFLQPGSNGIPRAFEGDAPILGGDGFGRAVAAGDFDADGYDDLAIGIPEQFEPDPCGGPFCGFLDVGAVLVLGGGIGGVMPFHGFYMMEGDQGLPDTREPGDRFGQSVAAADFNADGFEDLAIGVPQEDGVGAVLVVFGSPNSLIFANHRFWGEFDLGQPGELDDRFAETLATGEFDGDGYDDLAIGASYEDLFSDVLGDVVDAGAVTVLHGAEPGFDLGRTQYLDQRFGEPLDVESQPNDHFGWALAAGDFDRDGHEDLAVGHYGEASPGGFDVGAVTVLMGSASSGLRVERRRRFQPDVDGLPGGEPDVQRYVGQSVAAGDFDADGHADLAIGVPLQDAGGLTSAGNEVVLYGSLFSDGFGSGDASSWSIAVP